MAKLQAKIMAKLTQEGRRPICGVDTFFPAFLLVAFLCNENATCKFSVGKILNAGGYLFFTFSITAECNFIFYTYLNYLLSFPPR